MNKISELQEIIDNSDNIVFFGGAGVSTESGEYLISDLKMECLKAWKNMGTVQNISFLIVTT